MTVDEYITPHGGIVFFTVLSVTRLLCLRGAVACCLLQNRLAKKSMTKLEKWNVYFTNIMIGVMAVLISLLIGWKAYLLIQLPIILFGHCIGIWLFYIQHQFDEVDWERNPKWDYRVSAITGSSFLKLPAVLQWFTGNIGYHHVHHLSSRIPNYYLEKCHNENEIFREVKPIILFSTFKALTLGLWDEASRRMISFRKNCRNSTENLKCLFLCKFNFQAAVNYMYTQFCKFTFNIIKFIHGQTDGMHLQ